MTPKPPIRPLWADPFRLLAVACIVLGMLIVVGSIVLWLVTGRANTAIIETGGGMAIGGGFKEMVSGILDRFPTGYSVPPAQIPGAHTEPPPHEQNGTTP